MVKYEIYEKILGMHKIRGIKIEGEKGWWYTEQYQWVNSHWESAGCNWYSQNELESLLNELEPIECGTGKLLEEEVEGETKYILTDVDQNGLVYDV